MAGGVVGADRRPSASDEGRFKENAESALPWRRCRRYRPSASLRPGVKKEPEETGCPPHPPAALKARLPFPRFVGRLSTHPTSPAGLAGGKRPGERRGGGKGGLGFFVHRRPKRLPPPKPEV